MIQTILECPVPRLPKQFSLEAIEFVDCCLQTKAEARVPASVLLKSPWFKIHGLKCVDDCVDVLHELFRT